MKERWIIYLYDENIRNIGLTSDEIEILKEVLPFYLDSCTSIGEEITIRELLDKLG